MDGGLIYVYCIADGSANLVPAISGEVCRCLLINGFIAIVKNVSPDEFSEENLKKNFADLKWIELHARDHIRIIGEVMKAGSVIPFKFGTIFNSEENLGKFVDDYSDSLTENLQRIKGKEEWSVKIYCDRRILTNEITNLNDGIHALDIEIAASNPGKAFLLKRKRTELVGQEVDKVIRECGQSCYDKLTIHCKAVLINNILPQEVTERKDDMILNVSCFLNQEKINDFRGVLAELQEKYGFIGFDIDAAGPWPPFSFISIKEK